VHTVELLDWATGGPRPPALAGCASERHPRGPPPRKYPKRPTSSAFG